MTVEDFILLCRMRKLHFTANWIEKRYNFFMRTLSPQMKQHLKKRAHEWGKSNERDK